MLHVTWSTRSLSTAAPPPHSRSRGTSPSHPIQIPSVASRVPPPNFQLPQQPSHPHATIFFEVSFFHFVVGGWTNYLSPGPGFPVRDPLESTLSTTVVRLREQPEIVLRLEQLEQLLTGSIRPLLAMTRLDEGQVRPVRPQGRSAVFEIWWPIVTTSQALHQPTIGKQSTHRPGLVTDPEANSAVREVIERSGGHIRPSQVYFVRRTDPGANHGMAMMYCAIL